MTLGIAVNMAHLEKSIETIALDQRWNLLSLVGWYAQHLGDDGGRQGQCVIADQIHPPGALGCG